MERTLIDLIIGDSLRMQALSVASTLQLPDWCIAAGFVRNLAWDYSHGKTATPLNDLDLIYFDPTDISSDRDRRYEQQLRLKADLPWSVKNQARMHLRNADPPYQSSIDAMSYWPECETAVGARIVEGNIELLAPFGIERLFQYTITLNPKRPKPQQFFARIERKHWLQIWPQLGVLAE